MFCSPLPHIGYVTNIIIYIYIYISNQGIVSFLWIFLFPSLASKEFMNDWWPEEGWIIDVIIWGWVIVGQCEEGFGLLFFFLFFYCWCLINWIYFINTFLHLLLLFPLKFLSLCEPGSYLPNYIWLKSVGTLVEFLRSLFGLDILTFFFFFGMVLLNSQVGMYLLGSGSHVHGLQPFYIWWLSNLLGKF